MKIVVSGLPKVLEKDAQMRLSRTAELFANGDGVNFVFSTNPVPEISIKIEGAKYVATPRLEAMLWADLAPLLQR